MHKVEAVKHHVYRHTLGSPYTQPARSPVGHIVLQTVLPWCTALERTGTLGTTHEATMNRFFLALSLCRLVQKSCRHGGCHICRVSRSTTLPFGQPLLTPTFQALLHGVLGNTGCVDELDVGVAQHGIRCQVALDYIGIGKGEGASECRTTDFCSFTQEKVNIGNVMVHIQLCGWGGCLLVYLVCMRDQHVLVVSNKGWL